MNQKAWKIAMAVLALVCLSFFLGFETLAQRPGFDPREDPLVSFNWGIVIDGQLSGYFTSCTGMGSETEVILLKVVENNREIVRKIPGRLQWNDVECSRGVTSSLLIWEWRQQVELGDVAGARKNIMVVMYNQAGEVVASWKLDNAWPAAVRADGGDGVEYVKIVSEGIERVE